MTKPPAWRMLLLRFIKELRIVSREVATKLGEVGTPLHLWNSQRRILDELTRGMDQGIREFYVLKSRQLGSSTIFVVIAIFWLAFHPRMKGAIVFDQDKTRDDFREQIRNIIASIPAAYFGGQFAIKKGSDNKYFMAFTNGSQLNFLVAGTTAAKVSWGESSGYSFVLLTEVANYGSSDGLSNFEEAMSEKNPQRLYIYESTAKGYNHWRDRWKAAKADPFTKRCIFVGWWSKEDNIIPQADPRFALFGAAEADDRERERMRLVHERHGHEITMEQLAWIRWRLSKDSQTESSLNQNQPWVEEDAFIMTGKSYFQTRLIVADYERVGQTFYTGYRFWLGSEFWTGKLERLVDVARKHETEMRVWCNPVAEARYVIGVDPAGGSDDKNDRHVCSVWRCYADRLVQVAEYADNRHETRQCAWVLAYMAGIYRNCLINMELSGGYGKAVMVELDHLRELLKSQVYSERIGTTKREMEDFLDNARYYIYRRTDSPAGNGYILNFDTTNSLKNQIFNEYRDAHVNGYLVINSKALLEEMQIITQEGSSISAPGKQRDDRCMAACFACHAWVQHERPGLLMQGETFERVAARENGVRTKGHIVDDIVAQFMKTERDGPYEVTPEQAWMKERGLA